MLDGQPSEMAKALACYMPTAAGDTKIGDFLNRLQSANSTGERNWLVTLDLLESLPANLAKLAWAAAIPHWFDNDVLAALRPELKGKVNEFYNALLTLPFIEPFEGRGHNIHELTRGSMRTYLEKERPREFLSLSRRAAAYFAPFGNLDFQRERIYHLWASDPEQGQAAADHWYQRTQWLHPYALSNDILGRETRNLAGDWRSHRKKINRALNRLAKDDIVENS